MRYNKEHIADVSGMLFACIDGRVAQEVLYSNEAALSLRSRRSGH